MDALNSQVLVVDDEATVLKSVAMLLESRGCEVEKLESGCAAVELLENGDRHFDCIVLDYSMPKMNGLATLQKIRALNINTPVILCSGRSFDQSDSESYAYWPEAILNKPFQLEQLLKKIESLKV